jgi:hypothetical protein
MKEMLQIWLDELVKSNGKTGIDELTSDEIQAEIEDIEGTIENERLWAWAEDIHYENIINLEAYLEVLYEMKNEACEYVPSAENGDYSPSNPWDAPGNSISMFININD